MAKQLPSPDSSQTTKVSTSIGGMGGVRIKQPRPTKIKLSK